MRRKSHKKGFSCESEILHKKWSFGDDILNKIYLFKDLNGKSYFWTNFLLLLLFIKNLKIWDHWVTYLQYHWVIYFDKKKPKKSWGLSVTEQKTSRVLEWGPLIQKPWNESPPNVWYKRTFCRYRCAQQTIWVSGTILIKSYKNLFLYDICAFPAGV